MTTPPPAPESGESAPEEETRRSRSFVMRAAAVAAVIALVGGVVGGLIVHFTSDDNSSSASGNETRCPAVTVADKVLPSVVTLTVRSGTSGGSGSGEVIRNDGYILTNDHVISAGATGGTIDVLFSNGQTVPARVVGRSIALDLAVLKVQPIGHLSVIGIGKSETLKVGQPVVALGAPLGLEGTVTSGIVSALGRDINVPAAEGETARLPGALQTDASINPGNSGGPLVDCDGRLVGVNTAIATVPNASGEAGGGSVGIGFAIPVDLATVVADQLIETGRFTPPTVGLTAVPIAPAVARQFDVADGLYVQAVAPGGPAAQAGVQPGDIVTEVNGKPTATPDSLLLASLSKRAGDQLTVEYLRDGQKHQTTVTLGASS